jgi:hypothetical protein
LNIGNGVHIDRVCGYADDIIQENTKTYKNKFKTYHNFSKISVIEQLQNRNTKSLGIK